MTPSLVVKIKIALLSVVLSTLMSEVGKLSKVSAWLAFGKSCGNQSLVICLTWLVLPLAIPTCLLEGWRI